jgi:predicted AlkP superfamily pyrophosphatase or phosphodiesterase
MMLRAISVSLLALSLAACATEGAGSPPAQASADEPIVLMIGVDGLRWDALDRYEAPAMQALADRGVRPEAMIPVMPSVTFTNFYSIATGLYPEDHGMTSNAPYDRSYGEGFVNPMGAQEERWWDGEPIWITAERQGLPSSIMFWLGSEVEFEGDRPTRWTPYEHDRDYGERVEEVLGWFDGPEDARPRFAAVYFDAVDTNGHRYGPDTPEVGEAIARVDGHIADLLAGLQARGLMDRTNVIIVSDHGMARVEDDQVIHFDDFIDLGSVYVPEIEGRGGNGYRPFLNVYGEPEAVEAAYQGLQGAHPNMRAWKRGEMPGHFRFDHPERGPDLFILADAGWTMSARDLPMGSPWRSIGVHGYDPLDPLMHAGFIAAGPAFPEGARPAAFENVNVYLLIACILGLDPAETAGDPAVVAELTGGRCETGG